MPYAGPDGTQGSANRQAPGVAEINFQGDGKSLSEGSEGSKQVEWMNSAGIFYQADSISPEGLHEIPEVEQSPDALDFKRKGYDALHTSAPDQVHCLTQADGRARASLSSSAARQAGCGVHPECHGLEARLARRHGLRCGGAADR
jgi:hypothetical protein